MKRILLILLTASIFFQCTSDKKTEGLIVENAMVVSAREESSTIGVEILKKGGTAFDAMIATDLALAVAYPYSGNITGGGFMVYRTKDGKTGALDYREKAPIAASRDMYLDEHGNVIKDLSTKGALAVGVPGTVAGLFAVHKKFGTLPFSELIQPAIELAKKGVVVTKKQEARIAKYEHYSTEVNGKKTLLNKEWKQNDTIKYLQLATTFERIRDQGKDGFYKGKTAETLVNHLQENGGIITLEDLEKYEAKWRNPLTFQYKDLTVISMTLPSSGSICLAQILKSIEPFDIVEMGQNSPKYVQLLTEAERRAYADRAHFLGDIDFIDVPIDSLTDATYIKNRMSNFTWDVAGISDDIKHGKIIGYESDETTHYSIVDQFGNAVSVTTTLNSAYGSKVFIEELGFFLNNQMDDFSVKPGVPNIYGLVGNEANSIASEKRMLSSMTPTIVEQDGKLKMVVGTPGGSTIITSVLQNILNVTQFGMGMQESVSSPRFHHQWLPDNIRLEPNSFDEKTKKALLDLGYELNESNSTVIGKVDAILVLPDGKLEGGADPRGDDKAVGY
ncbi:MAG: gamma-glutamyltransferase [Urechidicola sp.]|nr:gamma-glutamyltransferase [Urechidicola sp.]